MLEYGDTWRSINVGQRIVEYHDLGGLGPVLVLLHGGQCTARDWECVVAPLAEHHRLILPDGFVHPMEPWALWRLLDFLEVDNPILLGHSAGGPMIREMYQLAPQRVKAMIAIDGSTFGPLQLARKMPNDLFSDHAKAMYQKNHDRMMRLRPHHRGDYPSEATLDCRFRAYEHEAMSTEVRMDSRPQAHLMGTVDEGERPTPVDPVGRFIHCPSLVVQTGRGKIGREDITDAYIDENMQAKDLEYVVIKEAGHWPWIEDPETFLAILTTFLRRIA